MADVTKFTLDGTDINVKDSTARTNIGNLTNLITTVKTDLVSAVNEVAGETGDVSITYNSTTEAINIVTT